MPRSMKKPNTKRVGNCANSLSGKRFPKMSIWKKIKMMLITIVVIPSVHGKMKVVTYGRLVMGDVPNWGRVLNATPNPARNNPIMNKIKRLCLLMR